MSDVDVDLLIWGRRPRRRWLPAAALAVVVAGVAAAFLLLRPDETDVVVEVQQAEATTGQLTTTLELSGSAAAERSATLTFEAAGTVASVEVDVGDAVRAGDALAALEDQDARRRVETATVQLEQARLRLDDLLADPAASELASSSQSLESAESQVGSAEHSLEQLLAPPGASEVASAEQAVANALGQLSSAEEALALLTAEPGPAELASAEQAVANALGQLSSAEEALALLTAEPGEAELASAEQAVANARGQLSSAEEALAALTASPGEAEVASARSSVTQARAQLTSAVNQADQSGDALEEAFTDYCDVYAHLADVTETTCAQALPLADEQVAALRDSTEPRSATYGRYADAVIAANVAFVTTDASRESAVTALATAEERLADLLAPATTDDRYQSEQAVEAARASYAGALARLADLTAPPSEQDLFQAERAVEAAEANHAGALARLADLTAPPSEQNLFQAERAVEAAEANHAGALARLADLTAPPDEGDLEQARAALENARAALLTARARYDELQSGPTANAISQQELSVRLAEISLEAARSALLELTLLAPFDGVIASVGVRPGDRVNAAAAAFTVSTPNSVLIELTVTETDLLDLEVGQAGLASFDAIEGVEYPVRIVSVGRVPNAAQGVVTYDVAARLLAGAEVAEVASELAILGGAGAGAAALPGAGGLGGAAGGLGRASGPLAGLELPEGMTLQQLAEALASGGPLPEGVTLPEGLEIPPQLLQRLAAGTAGTRGGAGAGAGTGAAGARPLAVPGMSASVTILTAVREPAVLLPVAAVRRIDGAWFVAVPAAGDAGDAEGEQVGFERVEVEVGTSDGVSVEITSGLDEGAVVLLGADNDGVPFSATRLPEQAPGGFGGFFPGAGGGGRGFGGGGQ